MSGPTAAWPLYMRRSGFDPAPELSERRDRDGVVRTGTPFGIDAWLVTRFADVRTVMADSRRCAREISSVSIRPTTPGCGACWRRNSPRGG